MAQSQKYREKGSKVFVVEALKPVNDNTVFTRTLVVNQICDIHIAHQGPGKCIINTAEGNGDDTAQNGEIVINGSNCLDSSIPPQPVVCGLFVWTTMHNVYVRDVVLHAGNVFSPAVDHCSSWRVTLTQTKEPTDGAI